MKKLIKTFRRILTRGIKKELRESTSLDSCVDCVTVDMIKALYAAYHGLDDIVNDSDMITEWACDVLSQIQGGLSLYKGDPQ